MKLGSVTKHLDSTVYQLTALCDLTLCLLHRARGGVTKDKEKKKKVELKVWEDWSRSKSDGCFLWFYSLYIHQARIILCNILVDHTSCRDASRL